MARGQYLIDARTYSVLTSTGERRAGMTRAEAFAFAERRRAEWAGRVTVRIFYRDGTEV